MERCFLCRIDGASKQPYGSAIDAHVYECPRCGRYATSGLFERTWERANDSYLPFLSSHTRQATEWHQQCVELGPDNWREYAEVHRQSTPTDKMNKLLRAIQRRTDHLGQMAFLRPEVDYPLLDAQSEQECRFLLDEARSSGLLQGTPPAWRLTFQGHQKLEEQPLPIRPPPNDEKDDLLPLLRRSAFNADFPNAVKASTERNEPLAVLMLDLDRFKHVNDAYGHQVGDEVLKHFAQIVMKLVRGKGRAYRFGGDEFAVLLPNFSVGESNALAQAIRKTVEQSAVTGNQLKITTSIGVACLPDHASDHESLLKRSDEALYKAKKLGGNRVQIAGESESTSSSS